MDDTRGPAPGGSEQSFRSIAQHGLIGDLHTVALVGSDATIDWYCPGRVDGPSVFASLLDAEDGGRWALAPTAPATTSRQLYIPDTNVLVTRFHSDQGISEVVDFMCLPGEEGVLGTADGTDGHVGRIVRRVTCVRGQVEFGMQLAPRFDYGRAHHQVRCHDGAAVFTSSHQQLTVRTTQVLDVDDGDISCTFTLTTGQSTTFVLRDGVETDDLDEVEAQDLYDHTVAWWQAWIRQSTYRGRWREMVQRSALTLKLLTYAPTGAIVAAPTTSLPEMLGGQRNWDYRYTWIRDAAFSIYALLRLGFTAEATAFFDWLAQRFCDRGADERPLEIMYRIDGEAVPDEEVLDHLSGYRGSAPVRIGNAAGSQTQLDIYGELIDSLYLYNKYGRPLSHDEWTDVRRLVDWVCDHWDEADSGLWESRGEAKHFTFSRLMCWVAVERAIRVANQRGLPADHDRWLATRDAIHLALWEQSYDEDLGAFVQHIDDDVVDASILLMPLVKFVSPTDPKWLSTLEAIEKSLVVDSLVYRYDPERTQDGVGGEEGTFSMCSFWYVEALTRAGRVDQARLAFEKMLTYANPLGMYAEEIGPNGEQLGNFPQAFTHLGLISAAFNLDRALG
ncbi:glycoside hydrolase family 15 protein [Euzebya tangerina]|uniref:glycoside hydrolase family 15 protein n=1 Tax=Euzebya tangerina TaxID=591198 RepID=UPI00196AA90E|nr:glycoside hydrolase family 15 protein [Euzebya tangerina]